MSISMPGTPSRLIPGTTAHAVPLQEPLPDPVAFLGAAETFAVLASPARLHLLWLLVQGEQDVTRLAQALGVTVPTASQHLARLRLADLVVARPAGRRQIYRAAENRIVDLVTQSVDRCRDLLGPCDAPNDGPGPVPTATPAARSTSLEPNVPAAEPDGRRSA